MEKMAHAAAEGARKSGANVVVKRVPETVPEEVAKQAGFKLDQPAPSPAAKASGNRARTS